VAIDGGDGAGGGAAGAGAGRADQRVDAARGGLGGGHRGLADVVEVADDPAGALRAEPEQAADVTDAGHRADPARGGGTSRRDGGFHRHASLDRYAGLHPGLDGRDGGGLRGRLRGCLGHGRQAKHRRHRSGEQQRTEGGAEPAWPAGGGVTMPPGLAASQRGPPGRWGLRDIQQLVVLLGLRGGRRHIRVSGPGEGG
jgi:hypothetical protein